MVMMDDGQNRLVEILPNIPAFQYSNFPLPPLGDLCVSRW